MSGFSILFPMTRFKHGTRFFLINKNFLFFFLIPFIQNFSLSVDLNLSIFSFDNYLERTVRKTLQLKPLKYNKSNCKSELRYCLLSFPFLKHLWHIQQLKFTIYNLFFLLSWQKHFVVMLFKVEWIICNFRLNIYIAYSNTSGNWKSMTISFCIKTQKKWIETYIILQMFKVDVDTWSISSQQGICYFLP